jgi:hypothetical protein
MDKINRALEIVTTFAACLIALCGAGYCVLLAVAIAQLYVPVMTLETAWPTYVALQVPGLGFGAAVAFIWFQTRGLF